MPSAPEPVVRVEERLGPVADDAADREESAAEPSIGELLRLAQAHEALVARLRDSLEPEELDRERQLARFLRHELARRTATPRPDPRPHIGMACAAADLFALEVPRSRHVFPVGAAITGAKRALVKGLRPLHFEVLRPQRAFDECLTEVLYEVLGTTPVAGGAWAEWAEGRLAPLADPAAWHVRSGRAGVGRLIEGAKRSWLRLVGPHLAPLLARQQRWNSAAVRAVALAVGWDGTRLDEAHALLAALQKDGRPTAAREPGAVLRVLRPLWIELFRRQERFNVEVERAFGVFFGIPRPADDGGVEAYALWLATHEPAWEADSLARLRRLGQRPLLSIVMPTYQTDPGLLRAALDSVLAQTYDRWQLCIADDGSRSPEVRRLLSEYARRDRRIKIRFLATNGGIAQSTNAAINLASGDFVAFLDHDDELAPFALADVAAYLEDHPDTDVLYSDEDRIDPHGRRVLPYFKPDWSPDLLRAVNYACHFLVVRRELVEAVGRLRAGFDGSQDYDFVLRLSERTSRVGHIPRILYHWRASPTSTAQSLANKPEASAAGVRALEAHLTRAGESGAVDDPVPTSYRVRLAIAGTPMVSIVVAARSDGAARVERLAAALVVTVRHPRWELIVVGGDGRGPDGERVRRIPWTRPHHAAAMANLGARAAGGELLLFLHDDVEPSEAGWLEELAAIAQRDGVGAVGAKLRYADGTLEHAGFAVGLEGVVGTPFRHMADGGAWTSLGNPTWTRNCLAVSGACLMVARDRFERAGGFDDRFAAHADVALCARLMEAGLRNVYTPHVALLHEACRPRPAEGEEEALRVVLAPWLAHGDPFYNRNLSARRGNGRLRGES